MKRKIGSILAVLFIVTIGMASIQPVSANFNSELPGDENDDGIVSLGEVTDLINEWANDNAELHGVIVAINIWTTGIDPGKWSEYAENPGEVTACWWSGEEQFDTRGDAQQYLEDKGYYYRDYLGLGSDYTFHLKTSLGLGQYRVQAVIRETDEGKYYIRYNGPEPNPNLDRYASPSPIETWYTYVFEYHLGRIP